MTPEDQALLTWALISLGVACVCLTVFPLLYLFSPWFKSSLGWAVMLRGVAFALATDLTLLAYLWRPNDVTILLWGNLLVFAFLAGTSVFWTYVMIRLNYRAHKSKKEKNSNVRHLPV